MLDCLRKERQRQECTIELIASENFVSPRVLEMQGSILTNKYAEGYPQRRYYGGCAHVDEIESYAIDKACALFDMPYANVQPHSGSQANQAVYFALMQPGDTLLGMGLNAGGHLSHGAPITLSGRWFQSVSYGVHPQTGLIDFDQVRDRAHKHRPKVIIAGGSAYPQTIDFAQFRAIADEVGAYLMADIAHIAGLVVTQQHPSPAPYAHVVTSTTQKTLRGPRGGLILTSDPGLSKKINSAVFPGIQGGPLMHTIAAKAVCFQEALDPAFTSYIQNVKHNAQTLAKTLQNHGHFLLTNGTSNHMVIVDLSTQTMTGQELEQTLETAHITCNKNMIPFDKRSAKETSGIRLGTAACTTRGFQEHDFASIGLWIHETIVQSRNSQAIGQDVQHMCSQYPLPYGNH